MEAIVLAYEKYHGDNEAYTNLPACMVPYNGQPFLNIVLEYMEDQGVDHVILSLGYQYQLIVDWLQSKGFLFQIHKVVSQENLGTGGAIKLALNKSKEQSTFVIDSDRLIKVNLKDLLQYVGEDVQYIVTVDKDNIPFNSNHITIHSQGNIEPLDNSKNCLNRIIWIHNSISDFTLYPDIFSFEKEVLQRHLDNTSIVFCALD